MSQEVPHGMSQGVHYAQVVQRRLPLRNNYSVGHDRKEKKWANTEAKMDPNLKNLTNLVQLEVRAAPRSPLIKPP